MKIDKKLPNVTENSRQPSVKKMVAKVENKHQLWLSTKEANDYFVIQSPGRKSLVHRVIKHIVTAYKQAQTDSVYAIVQVLNWKNWMIHLSTQFQRDSVELEKALTIHVRQQRIKPPYQYRHTVGVANQLIGILLNLVSDFDHLIWLIECAKNAGIYPSISHYFKVKTSIAGRLSRLLGKIVYEPVTKLPAVTITDYLEETAAYLDAKKRFFAVKPTLLLSAIQTTVRPVYSKAQFTQITAQLYMKCRRLQDESTDQEET